MIFMNCKMGCKSTYGLLVLFLMLSLTCQSCYGSEAFGFNILHRFSDPVKAIFNNDYGFPEKGTIDYYAAMAHRDRVFHGRRLAGEKTNDSTLTFASGNTTFHITELGFLYYANVSVGTPESWFLVALDTGSHIFWLPCDCVPNCVTQLKFSSDAVLDFNIYSLHTSSTGTQLPCTSPLCQNSLSCVSSEGRCPYGVHYLQANTSSSGYMVEDILHLSMNSNSSARINAKIPFGCGVRQTGSFLSNGAPNGLLGLTMDPISLPSVLASQNLTSNSYSMCFTGDGIGKIIFGDRDSNEQGETPLSTDDPLNLYNVSITQISMGKNVSATNLTVIIDTGTSFTHLTDPAYSLISEKFDSQINDQKLAADPENPFEFCYVTSSIIDDLTIPSINLTMGSGDIFTVIDPTILFNTEDGRYVYCLAVFKSESGEHDINIIGENFLTGYRIVFDHERMVFGWKEHDCGEVVPVSPRPPFFQPTVLGTPPPNSSGAPSALAHSYFFICTILILILSV
ncbi:aspartyl protease family protein 1-like [Chenopodium quinoa]|uniref:aspartyl protease family protein 1-like n=1 Tax=Chenopodium quinoa TaxID=63459 RepID=UPI000B775F1F|nr:aspartyl protease family protein 1-like [Chenopodium quinoa]